MICSDDRKLCLCGRLKLHNGKTYSSPLKFQKYLFFYEAFMKANGYDADFSHLCGYKSGPVFSNVWEDYTKERSDFDSAAENAYLKTPYRINEYFAKKSEFIVSSLSERELSDLTHYFNIWKKKESHIKNNELQVSLEESDFDKDDIRTISLLDQMYPIDMINNSEILELDNHYFVFSEKDYKRLTESHIDALFAVFEKEQLINPIIVKLDKEGRLIFS